jgi:magnesium transporter
MQKKGERHSMFTIFQLKGSKFKTQKELPKKTSSKVWLHVAQPTEDQLAHLAERIGVEKFELHHAVDDDEHPRVFKIKNYLQVVLRVPYVNHDHEVVTTSCAFLISKTRLITFHEKPYGKLYDIMKQAEEHHINFTSPGAIFVYILDEIMKQYFSIVELLEDHIDEVEDIIFDDPTATEVVQEVFSVKKTLIYLYKGLTANRKVVMSLDTVNKKMLSKADLERLRYTYHDTTQLIDIIETLREIITSTLEIHVSGVSNKLNIAMKKLTVYGSIILIPTLIASIYGMNFRYMPELHWRYGYLFSLILMVVSAAAIYIYFKWSDWI